MKTGNFFIVMILLVLVVTNTHAQEENVIKAGDRVRITMPLKAPVSFISASDTLNWKLDAESLKGIVMAKEGSQLLLVQSDIEYSGSKYHASEHQRKLREALSDNLDKMQMVIPLGSIQKLEVSRGRKSNVLKGAGIGLLTGAAGGVAFGLVSSSSCDEKTTDCSEKKANSVVFGGIAFAAIGTAVGAGIGAVNSGENWQEVPFRQISE